MRLPLKTIWLGPCLTSLIIRLWHRGRSLDLLNRLALPRSIIGICPLLVPLTMVLVTRCPWMSWSPLRWMQGPLLLFVITFPIDICPIRLVLVVRPGLSWRMRPNGLPRAVSQCNVISGPRAVIVRWCSGAVTPRGLLTRMIG